jgi:serine/threonine protein kinase
MLRGLKDIHETGYVHTDIKPQNLMVVEDELSLKEIIEINKTYDLNNESDKKIKFYCSKQHELTAIPLTQESFSYKCNKCLRLRFNTTRVKESESSK